MRRLPVGAEPHAKRGTHFRIWAPASRHVSIVLTDEAGETGLSSAKLTQERRTGYFSGTVRAAQPGSHYWVELDDGEWYADPASRFQPHGPQGPSEVIDPSAFIWQDSVWPGPRTAAPVVYEMHIGTFTEEGTWAAAMEKLPLVADLGISTIEVLPIADFPGRFGWGYDGVLLFAPTRLYGRPDDVRSFIERAHSLGLAVILDVVYNHVGPDGCDLKQFSPAYFSSERTEWGEALNFDGRCAGPVREFISANARYWIDEFHFDGLRLDATHAIKDETRPDIIADVVAAVREAAGSRRTWIVGENEPQDARLLQPSADGGSGLDALWNDDLHHAAMVALTGRREAYYTDYEGKPQEFLSAAKYGFLYQGQHYAWQRQPRGSETRSIAPDRFVGFLQNHDQVANSLHGRRAHAMASPGRYRALTTLLLLGPWTPMLFQGEEFNASAPFLYFADHAKALAAAVEEGRREFLSQFPSIASGGSLAAPHALETFTRCKLDHRERELHAEALELHRSLIAIRRADAAFHDHARFHRDGAVLGSHALLLRWIDRTASGPEDRLLVVNLGPDELLRVLPEPLLAPPHGMEWSMGWSSDDPRVGGDGVREVVRRSGWFLPAESAFMLKPQPMG